MNTRPLTLVPALLAAGTLLGLPVISDASPAPRPNIIFILADDLGIDGVGVYGSENLAGLTPRLDAMASVGLRFDRAYAQPVCVPTRSQFLSGWYPPRNGAIANDGSGSIALPSRLPSLPAALREAGYLTAVAGKNHSIGPRPEDWGFDQWLTAPSGHYFGAQRNENGVLSTDGPEVYFPDEIHAWLIDFIQQEKPAPANDHRPFFLFYSLMNPHVCNQPGSAWDRIMPPTPWNPDETDDQQRYLDQIHDIDLKVGELLDLLTSEGIRQNTLVIFIGDNGTLSTYKSRLWNPATQSFQVYQGEKNSTLEGGSRVPMLLEWPAQVTAPATVAAPIDFTDFFATFLELAGGSFSGEVDLDGHSFAGLLLGDPDWTPRLAAFVQLRNEWYLRTTDYRLNRNGNLFDMTQAPFSQRRIEPPDDTPETAAIRAELTAALAQIDPENGITFEFMQDNRWSNPARAWKVSHFRAVDRWNSEIAGDLADPDGDGVSNLLERALGTDPNSPSTIPRPIRTGSTLSITYTEPSVASDTHIDAEVSPDLENWFDGPASVDKQGPGTPETTTTATDLGSGEKRFMRLRVERVTPWNQP